jgi:hypothetical protein
LEADQRAARIVAMHARNPAGHGKETKMLLFIYYVVAIAILILHFTGVLARHNLGWLVLVLAVTVFPVVIYL